MPDNFSGPFEAARDDWKNNDKVRRLWQRDASLWTGTDEDKWLGWLGITEEQLAHISALQDIAADIKKAGFKHALLLGMGGSSLCPEVLRMTFGKIAGYPELHVLDSTDPAQIKAIEAKVDLSSTICIVSSKSGSTLEPNIYKQYFFERVKEKVGESGGRQSLHRHHRSRLQNAASRRARQIPPNLLGRAEHWRPLFRAFEFWHGARRGYGHGRRQISAATPQKWSRPAAPASPPTEILACCWALILGVGANLGRDKLTIIASPGISDLGAWLEQLIAESTGKIGKGIIPVDREPLAKPDVYGNDRVFAYLRLQIRRRIKRRTRPSTRSKPPGIPSCASPWTNIYNLGQEFFRWEIATAVAGSIIGINAFNQPDVEASKIETKKLTSEYEKTGKLPDETPFFEGDGIKLYADEKNTAALQSGKPRLAEVLKAHLGRAARRRLFRGARLHHHERSNEKALQAIRLAVRDKKKVATVLGFGPRFLHSTGQAYKGGPNSGVFLQITCDDAVDLPVPGAEIYFWYGESRAGAWRFRGACRTRPSRACACILAKMLAAGLATLAKAVQAGHRVSNYVLRLLLQNFTQLIAEDAEACSLA